MCEYCRQFTCPAGCPNAEVKAVAVCEKCGDDIVAGEGYYEYFGNHYHEDCFEEVAVNLLLETGAVYKEAGDGIDEGPDMDDEYERYRDERLLED